MHHMDYTMYTDQGLPEDDRVGSLLTEATKTGQDLDKALELLRMYYEDGGEGQGLGYAVEDLFADLGREL